MIRISKAAADSIKGGLLCNGIRKRVENKYENFAARQRFTEKDHRQIC
jgi:hypothetical protein